MTITDCLPPSLQGAATVVTPIAAGLSGASVYRVEADGQSYVLKVVAPSTRTEDWLSTLHIQQLASSADLAPRIVHLDEARRAVLSVFIPDRSFVAFYRNPRTHEAAFELLGRTVRRIHALPLPTDAPLREPGEFLAQVWAGLSSGFRLPEFVRDAVHRVLTEEAPPRERERVVSHNDLNPSNLLYDGERIRVLDWDAAGSMDPFYDLAVLSVFLRMDQATCLRLLATYDGVEPARLPERFSYFRRLAAALAGTFQLDLARQRKHAGSTGAETLPTTLSLGEFYQQLQASPRMLGTAEGPWTFGLALLKESCEL